MNHNQRRLTAITFVAIMLIVPITTVNLVEDDNESDAAFWEPIYSVTGAAYYPKSALGLAFIAGGIVGFALGWTLYPVFHPSDGTPDDEVRRTEAAQLAASLATGMGDFDSALQTYTGIWGLTEEHWIRQAELTSSLYWQPETQYSPYAVMTTSGTYVNSATMLVNGVNQINGQFAKVMERISNWNNSDVAEYYGDGKMRMDFVLGTSSESFTGDEENLKLTFGSIVGSGNNRTVSEGRNAVYYVGGPVWASSDATMVGTNGNTIYLKAGWNDNLPDPDEWEQMDVYRLTPGVQYFGNFMYALETDGVENASCEFDVQTLAGTKTVTVTGRDPFVAKVAMGKADFSPESVGLTVPGSPLGLQVPVEGATVPVDSFFLSTVHTVWFTDEPEDPQTQRIAGLICRHPWYREQTNVNMVKVLDRRTIRMRTWERGVGMTLACGTGACAAALDAYRKGACEQEVTVLLPKGSLQIQIEPDGSVWMSGPAKRICKGVYEG